MRTAEKHKPSREPDSFDYSDSTMKTLLYWVLVVLAFICLICVGIMVIHWSINWRMT